MPVSTCACKSSLLHELLHCLGYMRMLHAAIIGTLQSPERIATLLPESLVERDDTSSSAAKTRLLRGLVLPEKPSGACDEAAAYKVMCNAQHLKLRADLAAARGRKRGMIFRFGDRESVWGLGHALPAVYLLHDICRKAERVCHIQIYDMELRKLFGYANGASWDVPESVHELEHLYGPTNQFKNVTLDKSISAHGVADALAEQARQDEAPLVRVESKALIPFDSDVFLPALPWDRGHDVEADAGLGRCANRFVSEPRFNVSGSGCGSGSVVYHLRTGFADIPDTAGGAKVVHNATSARRWLAAACPAAPRSTGAASAPEHALEENALELKDGAGAVVVLSDAPGFIRALRGGGEPRGHASEPVTTRSWSAPFAAKLAAARDVVRASQCTEAYGDVHSSFLRPAVARSLCSRHAYAIDAPSSMCHAFKVCAIPSSTAHPHLRLAAASCLPARAHVRCVFGACGDRRSSLGTG